MQIESARPVDLPAVRAAYAYAREIQKARGATLWPEFSDVAILREMRHGCLLRVVDGDMLAGVFSVAYEDAAIWGERERGAHIYLHRIARAAEHPTRGLVTAVLDWAHGHCRASNREGLRMDTWASNTDLISLYERHGFRVIGMRHITVDARLPAHYHNRKFALLEAPCLPSQR
jgi:ribosomal protein S18 acetylase RimI-like enzyme